MSRPFHIHGPAHGDGGLALKEPLSYRPAANVMDRAGAGNMVFDGPGCAVAHPLHI